jgi:hypothetical protein
VVYAGISLRGGRMHRRTGGRLKLAVGLIAFAVAGLVVAGAGAGAGPNPKSQAVEGGAGGRRAKRRADAALRGEAGRDG